MQFLVDVRSYCLLYFVLLFSHTPTFHFDTLISFKVYTILKCLHLPQKCLLYLVCSNTVELERPYFLGVKSVSVVPSCICYCFSDAQSRLTLCDPMDCSMPDFPILHYLPELAQAHVHGADDAIQPSHPLSPPSPSALNLSQHQHLFQCVGSSH